MLQGHQYRCYLTLVLTLLDSEDSLKELARIILLYL